MLNFKEEISMVINGCLACSEDQFLCYKDIPIRIKQKISNFSPKYSYINQNNQNVALIDLVSVPDNIAFLFTLNCFFYMFNDKIFGFQYTMINDISIYKSVTSNYCLRIITKDKNTYIIDVYYDYYAKALLRTIEIIRCIALKNEYITNIKNYEKILLLQSKIYNKKKKSKKN